MLKGLSHKIEMDQYLYKFYGGTELRYMNLICDLSCRPSAVEQTEKKGIESFFVFFGGGANLMLFFTLFYHFDTGEGRVKPVCCSLLCPLTFPGA